MESIYNEITTKIDTSMPRGVVSTTKKSNAKIIDDNNLMEINYDDIK
jgi:hypothetical protein